MSLRQWVTLQMSLEHLEMGYTPDAISMVAEMVYMEDVIYIPGYSLHIG